MKPSDNVKVAKTHHKKSRTENGLEERTACTSCRGLFLSLMGAVYFSAFMSYYIQYPGILGNDGLLPVRPFWEEVRSSRLQQTHTSKPLEIDLRVPFGWWTDGVLGGQAKLPRFQLAPSGSAKTLRAFLNFPTWCWFLASKEVGLDVDQVMEGLALSGALFGLLAFLGVHHVLVFFLLYTNYLSLYVLGQRWLTFQWDIFLLETGVLVLLYCPIFTIRATRALPPVAWLLRAFLVKFMWMNGVVKVSANCPTWRHLTALEYHFASTCIPTAEAWTLHQLPPFILRLGTAAMFLIELAGPWLLLAPVCAVRRVGALLQAGLQLGILATGNYNWFNLHTIALLLPAWDKDDYSDGGSGGGLPFRAVLSVPWLWGRAWSTKLGSMIAVLVSCGFLAWASVTMFEFRMVDGNAVVGDEDVRAAFAALVEKPSEFIGAVRLALSTDYITVVSRFASREISKASKVLLSPRALQGFFSLVGVSCVRYVLAPLSGDVHQKDRLPRWYLRLVPLLLRLVRCALVLPMLAVCLSPLESVHRGFRSSVPFHSAVMPLAHALDPWQASSSYGLFRMMTGVGQARSKRKTWGNLPLSVVEVPVVVVEGSDDGAEWQEIPFRYTPGTPTKQPRRTAPHQPRLDWQMWFAALGAYEHNPWFVHLLYKILDGSQPVIELLDFDNYPWRGLDGPKYVRSWLYHYDFTRCNTAWAKAIPGTRILNFTGGTASREEWWTRSKVRPYTPTVSAESLRDVIVQQGWPAGKRRKVQNCKTAEKAGVMPKLWCQAVVKCRTLMEPWQQRSGWSFRSEILRHIWEGASDLFYLDMNFVLIVGPLIGCAALSMVSAILWRK